MDRFDNLELPLEEVILREWDSDLPVVSVLCTSYNHQDYIDDAIRGFILQKTKFPFEIIIHDDKSTDSTAQIIRNYAEQYPRIIKTILQEENQYSQGVKVMLRTAGRAKGEFLAFCEGDDYWISEDKLQMQVDALRDNLACEICFHSAFKTTRGVQDDKLFCKHGGGGQVLSVGAVIRGGGSFMPTASMLIRKTFFDRILEEKTDFFEKYLMGYFYQIFCSLAGGALYVDRPMSVYRSMAVGSWSEKMECDLSHYKEWLNDYLVSLREADVKTNYKYTEDFMVPIRRCHLGVLNNIRLDVGFRQAYFCQNKKEIGLVGKALWYGVLRYSLFHAAFKKIYSLLNKCIA